MTVALAAVRVSVLGCLLAVIGLAWSMLVAMTGHEMMSPATWTAAHAASILAMWVLMMVAMMLPSALPMILILDRFQRKGVVTALFSTGYMIVWIGFSIAATLSQWALDRMGLLSASMAVTSTRIAAAVFIAAGVYQFTPSKRACLDACRSPVAFLAARWQDGRSGALRMGLTHGVYCLGCCWLLMALLFVGGVMNLLWIVPVALFVLIEKFAPTGAHIRIAGGVLFTGWGVVALIWS
jgi:predicted metal-binding membrane protein